MPTRCYFLLCILLCALQWHNGVQALPLLGGEAPATVELEAPQPELARQLNERLKSYADSLSKSNGTPSHRQLHAERTIIKKQLRALGYYEAHIESLPSHRYRIATGPRYVIRQWSIEPAAIAAPGAVELALQPGQPLLAEDVLAARSTLLAHLREQCFPRARVAYEVILDARQHHADIRFTIRSGAKAHIGSVVFEGLQSINAEFLGNVAGLKPAACLRYKELDQARLALLQSGLLSSVTYSVSLPAPQEAGASVPATVKYRVSERKSRSVKATLGYTTDAKEGITLGWEHRNLFGDAERLELEGGIDQISRRALGKFSLPQFFHPQQELQLIAEVETEEPDAYISRTRELAAIVSRQWRGGRHASVGVALTESRIVEEEQSEQFSLLSLPIAWGVDRRDRLIDPRSGWALDLAWRPFTELSEEDLDFMQSAVTVRAYASRDDWLLQPSLALRVSAGSLTGAALQSIPADQRFYVGGGGSVRGYPYQTVGELTDGKADGGKSYSETSLELRLKFSADWGAVVFADGGYAYPDELPELGYEYLWGAGVGLRYFTRFAPIRVDVAFPLDRRDGVDNRLQLYISLGQAF